MREGCLWKQAYRRACDESPCIALSLDSIQFYHGPSKLEKLPFSAFDNNQKCSNTFLRVSELYSQTSWSCRRPMIRSSLRVTYFLLPAANAGQNADKSLNSFDLELARSEQAATSLSTTRAASHRDAYDSLLKLDCHRQERSDEKMPCNCMFKV